MHRRTIALLALPLLAFQAPPKVPRSLLNAVLKVASNEISVTRTVSGVAVKIAPGENAYPGVGFAPTDASWDLSGYGHVEARLVNTGPKPLTIGLRVDNAGDWRDNPWNTESVTLAPGASGTVRTVFGLQYGMKKGFALDPAKVVNVLLFTTKADGSQSFRVESLVAGGAPHERPPVAPDDGRTKPKAGDLLDSGGFDLRFEGEAMDLSGTARPQSALSFRSSSGIARFEPKVGRWDLRDATQVRVTVRNMGYTSATPRVRLETNGGDSAWVSSPQPLVSLATIEIVVPFGHLIDLGDPKTTGGIKSDAIRAVALSTEGGGNLEVVSVRAESPVAVLPDWLGKRPPVAGAWTKTLDQEFDGVQLDPKVWKVTGENYYDKQTHWAKDDVVLRDGMVRLRYEKKTGFQNDDPKRNSTPYAAGYLDTFGLWAQRYGYFEARMKLPNAPGLWPAFWMMPDRGASTGEQWKRQSTAEGGMEFDIMEGLTRWGPHRYNISMHYDGYEKDHKALGSETNYVETDKDGFVTCSLLWTPGEAVYYCNGREILRWKNPRVSSVPSILMFTLPMGGWDNDDLDDARPPADFAIDYVRVWQRKDLASVADGRR